MGDRRHTVCISEHPGDLVTQHAFVLAALAKTITFRKDIGILRQGETGQADEFAFWIGHEFPLSI